MCWNEILIVIREQCPGVTVAQIRWAISSGKIPRPPLDGSLRFNFDQTHLKRMVRYFTDRPTTTTRRTAAEKF